MEFPFAADPSKSIIRYVDFGKPVLDFTLRLASTEVWVSLDTSWKAETTPAGVSDPGTSHFKCLHWENEHVRF